MIRSELINYMKEVNPINDRIMIMKINYARPIYVIVAYAPTATGDERLKEEFYRIMMEQTEKCNRKGPTYVIGDFNART